MSTFTRFSGLFSLLILVPFAITAQTLLNVTPNTGTRSTTLNVTITGQSTNFIQGTSSYNVVRLEMSSSSSTINGYNNTALSTTSLKSSFNIPGFAPLGVYDLVVSNSVDEFMKMTNAVTINAGTPPPTPSITTVTPDSAILGQTLWVTITTQNTNFTAGSGTIITFMTQGTNTNITGLNETVLGPQSVKSEFTIPAPYNTGWYSMVVNGISKTNAVYINGGTSSINGTVAQNAKASQGGAPIQNLGMYLMSWKNDTLLETETNLDGYFEFTHLPYGTYKLFGDKLDNSNPLIIKLDENTPNLENMELVLNGDRLVISGVAEGNLLNDIQLYPNPFTDQLNISLNLVSSAYVNITLYDVSGKEVKSIVNDQMAAGTTKLTLQTGDKGAQIFFVKVAIEGEAVKYYKLIQLD